MGEPVRKPSRLSQLGWGTLLLGIISLGSPWLWATTTEQDEEISPAAATKRLHSAAIFAPDQIERLIKAGAEVNDTDQNGTTPLWKAVRSSKVESVKTLLAAKADPNIPRDSDSWTPLLCNAFVNKTPASTEIAKLLLASGAKVDVGTKRTGETALHFAVRLSDSTELVKLLLDAGANANIQDKKGSTPLQFAVSGGKPDVADLLLSRGADPAIRNDSGFRPIDQINAITIEDAKKIQAVFNSHKADSQRRVDLIRAYLNKAKAADKVAENTKTEDTEREGQSLLIELHDVDGKPVKKTRIRVFDGSSYWSGRQQRYKMQIARTNAKGLATFDDFFKTIPDRAGYWIQVFREKDETWRAPSHLSGRGLKLSKADSGNPLVQSTLTVDGLKVAISLRQECPTDIKIVDATNGKRRHFAQLLFKDDRVDDWTLAALQDYVGDPGGDDPSRLGLDFFTTMIPEMSDAQFMATREGYYPVEFRLKEKLSVDKQLNQLVELEPAPLVELTVLGIDGSPIKDAKLKYSGPDMRGSYGPSRPTDKNGRTLFLYPELGRLARYTITHQDGIGEFSMANLPEQPKLHWQTGKPPKLGLSNPSIKTDGNRWAVIRHTVQLRPATNDL